jgi:hypothetical protein
VLEIPLVHWQHATSTHAIMSSSENPGQTTPPSASDTVAAESKLERAIQDTCRYLGDIFTPECEDHWIENNLDIIWFKVYRALLQVQAEDSKLKARLRNESEFYDYVTPASKKEEFITLLRRMAKREVAWSKLFENGKLLSSI